MLPDEMFDFGYHNKELAAFVNELFDAANDSTVRNTDNWRTYFKYYLGDQTWNDAQKPYCQVANLIGFMIERIIAEYAKSDLAPVISGQQDMDAALARALSVAAQKCIERGRFSTQVVLADLYSNVFGSAVWKVEWSPEVRDMAVTVYPPFDFWFDPVARDLNGPHGCRYVIQATLQDLDYLKARWKRRDLVTDMEAGHGIDVMRYPWRDADVAPGNRKKHMAIEKQCWIRDADLRRYPHGRVVTIVGNTTVDDRPNPYFSGFPFAVQYAKPPYGEMYGPSLIADLKPVQDTFNRRLEQIVANENVMANPTLMTDDPRGVRRLADRGFNDVIALYPGRKAAYLQWMGMPPGIYRSLDMHITLMEKISGIHDIAVGQAPADVRSGVALNLLSENQLSSIRLKERYRFAAILDVFKMVVKGIQQFYDKMDVYKLVDPKLFFSLDWERAEEDILRETDVNIRIEPNKRTERVEALQLAMELFQLGVVDRQAVLERTDWIDRDEVLQRMESREAMQQEEAAAQQAAELAAGQAAGGEGGMTEPEAGGMVPPEETGVPEGVPEEMLAGA